MVIEMLDEIRNVVVKLSNLEANWNEVFNKIDKLKSELESKGDVEDGE